MIIHHPARVPFRAVCGLLLLASTVHAQFTPHAFFVDSAFGVDSTTLGAGTFPINPFKTIGFAVAQANAHITANPSNCAPVVINVFPGTYSDQSGEVFPITLPASGIVIEAYGNSRPVVDPEGTTMAIQDAFLVNDPGPSASCRPGTLIQNLVIHAPRRGIYIDPSITAAPPQHTAVQVRGCRIELPKNSGITIWTQEGWTAEHVVEDCDIVGGPENYGQNDPFGIEEICVGASSCLYRSNRIWDVEDALFVQGLGNGGNECQPRIFSNFLYLAERLVTLDNCTPFVVNNTIAFNKIFSDTAQDFIASGDILFGVDYQTGSAAQFTFANNIVWTPDVTFDGVTFAVPDRINVAATADVWANDFEDMAPQTTPDLKGNLGVYPEFVHATGAYHPVTNPYDLHLKSTSPVIDMAWAYFDRFVPGLSSPASSDAVDPAYVTELYTTYAGMTVRRDIPSDVDTGPRFVLRSGSVAKVDMGGDEVAQGSVSVPSCAMTILPSSEVDAFGTLHTVDLTTTPPTLATTLTNVNVAVTGTVGHAVFLYATIVANPLDQNLFHPTYGNAMVNLVQPGYTLPFGSTGTIGASGVATLPVNIATIQPLYSAFFEADFYIQAVVVDPVTGAGQGTNRLRLEVDF